jgi:hypothetical protein
MPRNPAGRPRRVSAHDLRGLEAEDVIDKVFETLAFEAVRMRRNVERRGSLSPTELKHSALLARALEVCAQAKRHLIEAAKAEDLSSVPTDQLVRVVVGQMRKLPELHAAIVGEINRRKPAEEEKPA